MWEDRYENDDLSSDDYYEHEEFTVDAKQAPLRIDKFLQARLFSVSRSRIQNAIRAGSVLVNGLEIKPNHKIKGGEHISMVYPKPPEQYKLLPQNIPLDIRYEDEDLLIVHKPAGMVVHPGVGHARGTLVNALAYYLGQTLPILDGNTEDRVGLVHRIDKNTSGLMVVAKNDFAMAHLAKQFFHHTIERTYNALVWGEPEPQAGSVNAHIDRDPKFRQRFKAFPDGSQGKWAVTHYKVLESLYYVSLVQCNLETGRTHQIRVHMQHLGHPLFSDDRYGGDRIVKGTIYSRYKEFVDHAFSIIPRHALHAKSLGFEHPRTGQWMQFESELPADFITALQVWREYVAQRRQSSGIHGLN
jgi:23S rRNA pseudouridine1911/1915/1917 synthase